MQLCGNEIGLDKPFFLMAGPCVIESEGLVLETASHLKELCLKLDIPFILINPAIEPRISLKKYIGEGIDWVGKNYHLSESVVAEYSKILTSGIGLVFLDSADKVIDAGETLKTLTPYFNVKVFEGGSHRFEHIIEALPTIKDFYNRLEFSHGFGEN